MTTRLTCVVVGRTRYRTDVLAELYGEHWHLFDPIRYTGVDGKEVVIRAVHDHNVLEKHLEAPASAGSSAVGGA